MKIKTAELIDIVLDWAVAVCEGKVGDCEVHAGNLWYGRATSGFVQYRPSTDPAQGFPIKTRELIATKPRFPSAGWERPEGKWVWRAHLLGPNNLDDNHEQEDESELVAAMRCRVAIKPGDAVAVPEEWLPATKKPGH